MTNSSYKMPLFLGIISTLILPFLTFGFIGLSIVRLEIGLNLFSFFYTFFDLLYPFFYLFLFGGNLLLLKALFRRVSFDRNTLSIFHFLLKSNFIVFVFLILATMFFSMEPRSEVANTLWLASFSIGLLLNLSIGIFLMIQARSTRKLIMIWIGFAFALAQFFDYSAFRVLLVFTEDISSEFLWNYIGLSSFDYNSMYSETKNLFDELTSISLFLALSIGAIVVLIRTVALAMFYVFMAQLLYMYKKPKKASLNSNEEKKL